MKNASSDEKGKHSKMAMRGVARPQIKMDGDKKDDSKKHKDKKSGGEMKEMSEDERLKMLEKHHQNIF